MCQRLTLFLSAGNVILICYSVVLCGTYRDIDEDGGLNVVPFLSGGLAAGEQSRALALSVLNVLQHLLKLFLVNLAQRTESFRASAMNLTDFTSFAPRNSEETVTKQSMLPMILPEDPCWW